MRRFLGWSLCATLVAFILVDGWLAHARSVESLHSARDRVLSRVAAGYLRALRQPGADMSGIPLAVFREELGASESPFLRFHVTDEYGGHLAGDANLRAQPALVATQGSAQAAYYNTRLNDEAWRVAALRDHVLDQGLAHSVVVQVAEPLSAREQAQRSLLIDLLAGRGIRLLAALAMVSLLIRFGLRPLDDLRLELSRRRPQDLTLVASNRPAELAPIVAALNELLRSQQESIDQQRKFLADASHQLRTPLAVLRTQVQSMLFKQGDPSDTLPKMLRTIDRAAGLTNQLLSLAKVEQLVKRGDWCEVQLRQIAQDVAVEFAPLMAKKRLDFSLQATPIALKTDAWMLNEMLKNLVSNAIHHSPHGGALGVVIRRLKNEAEMVVWDHGGGIEEGVLDRLFEPFNAASGGTGIGLGLSICRQIAESMSASVNLFNRIEGGRIVGVDAVVRWPLALTDHAAPAVAVSDPREASPPSTDLRGLDRPGLDLG